MGRSLLKSNSTYWVTLLRLGLILLPYLSANISFMDRWNSPFLTSILVRPHQSLAQMEEAHAIRTLVSNAPSTTFSNFYAANDSIRIPPLVLSLFSPLIETTLNPGLWLSIILLLVDLAIAYLLEQIGMKLLGFEESSQATREEEELQRRMPESIQPAFSHIFPIYNADKSVNERAQPLIPMNQLPLLAAQFYYFSPFTVLPSSLYCCWQNITPFFLLLSIYEMLCQSSDGSLSAGSLYLAIATYLEPYHLVYVLPIAILPFANEITCKISLAEVRKQNPIITRSVVCFVVFFGTWSIFLQVASYSLVGSTKFWKVFGTVYGHTWLTRSPNLSLQWYFQMQLFSRFYDYFGAIFAVIPLVLVGPICIRFLRYPMVQIAIWAMVSTLYRPVQVLYDVQIAICFMLFSPRSMARMGYLSTIAFSCIAVPLLLNVVDHWMWLEANNGNANYIYFQCLAHNVFLATIFTQFVSASMQRDKALRLVYKLKATKQT